MAILMACAAVASPSLSLAQTAKQRPNANTAKSQVSSPAIIDPASGDDAGGVNRVKPAATATRKAGPIDTAQPQRLNDPALRLRGVGDEAETADFGRRNLRENRIDGQRTRAAANRDETAGIRLGTFTLRPSVTQSVATEQTRNGAATDRRAYLQTGLKGTLTSDWSSHALTVTGDGVWQKNISGTGETKPSANIDADLRLDFADDTVAHVIAGYRFLREDTDDPNAISGARVQSGVSTWRGGVSLQRDFGILRGTAGLDLDRTTYSDVVLADGSSLSLQDRNRTSGRLRGRIGYELSPAIIPFLEASIGRSRYDLRTDRLGFARSSQTYAAKTGVEVNLSEKLNGEFGVGYEKVFFDDERLAAISAMTVDSRIAWSPQRGTDVVLGFSTSVEPSTTAGDSGYVSYAATAGITHQMRDDLIARLTGATTWRRYPSDGSRDETVYGIGPGLTWGINRYLDLTGDVGYELTSRKTNTDTQILRAGIGLTLKR